VILRLSPWGAVDEAQEGVPNDVSDGFTALDGACGYSLQEFIFDLEPIFARRALAHRRSVAEE
jgi:hypothetical protein